MKKLVTVIKWLIEIVFNLNLFWSRHSDEEKIVLLLTPQYLNWGDHAIALEEKAILKKMFSEKNVLEINFSFYTLWPKKVRRIINNNDTIVITGGGFMGDIWPQMHESLEQILAEYKKNKIIVAPQTIFFHDKNNLLKFKKIVNQQENMYFFAREKNTYDLLTKEMNLSSKRCKLFPDVVLFSNLKQLNITKNIQRREIGLCLRNDCEGTLSKKQILKIQNILNTKYGCYCKIEMAYDHVEVPIWLRKIFVKKKFRDFSTKKLVITDRLHGMLFAAVTGTPCIVIDNVSKKVSGVYEWIDELTYVKLLSDINEIENAIDSIDISDISKYKREIQNLQKKLKIYYLDNIKNLFEIGKE